MIAAEVRSESAGRQAPAKRDVRERWRMGPEARGLMLVSAVLTAQSAMPICSA